MTDELGAIAAVEKGLPLHSRRFQTVAFPFLRLLVADPLIE
jgi:hypothetical protein